MSRSLTRPHSRAKAVRTGQATLTVLALISGAQAARTADPLPAGGLGGGSSILNTANFEYLSSLDEAPTVLTSQSSITVAAISAVLVTPSDDGSAPAQNVNGVSGGRAQIPYLIQNAGNVTETFALRAGSSDFSGNLTPPAPLSRLVIDDGNGSFGPEDTALSDAGGGLALGSISLNANEQRWVYFDVDLSGAPDGSQLMNLEADSSGNTDENNVAQLNVTSQAAQIDITSSESTNVQWGLNTGMYVGITNSGSATLQRSWLRGTVTAPGWITPRWRMLDGSGPYATLDDAIAALPPLLPPGETWYLRSDYQVAGVDPTTDTVTHTFWLDGVSGAANNTPSATPQSDTDTLTQISRAPSVTLNMFECQDPDCLSLSSSGTVNPQGRAVIVLSGNTDGHLVPSFGLSLRGWIPAHTSFLEASASNSRGAPMLYATSTDPAAPRSSLIWSAAPPTSLASGQANTGPYIYLAYDSNGNGQLDSGDAVPTGTTIWLRLKVQVTP